MQSKGRTLAKTHIRQHTSTKNKSDNCSINTATTRTRTHTHTRTIPTPIPPAKTTARNLAATTAAEAPYHYHLLNSSKRE